MPPAHDANSSPPRDADSEDRASGEGPPPGRTDLERRITSGPPDRSPAWAPFDPGDLPELQEPDHGSGRVVAVVAATRLVGTGWALAATIELGRAWSERRPGAVLVDTDFSRPRMHRAVGIDNTVGLSEILRGDVPASRGTHLVENDRLFCVPAGNAPSELGPVFNADRWERLCRAFTKAGVTVVAYVPAEAPWAGLVLAQATDVVELRTEHGALDIVAPPHATVLAVLGPMPAARRVVDSASGQRAAHVPPVAFERDEEDPPGPAEDAVAAPPVPPLEPESFPAAHTGAPERNRADRRRRRLLVAMGATAGVLALAAGLHEWTGTPATSVTDPESDAAPAIAPEAGPISPDLRFSVAVASFRNRERAENRIAELSAAAPELPWYLAPVEVDGTVYQRVLGGFAADSASAAVLAMRLGERLGTDPDGWIVRATDVVIDMGEARDLIKAEAEVVRMRALGVPASVARVQYPDDSVRYRIYAGGYADTREASHLLATLASLGVDAAPSRRMGPPEPVTAGR